VRGERGRGEKKCAGFGCGEGGSGRGYGFEWAQSATEREKMWEDDERVRNLLGSLWF
jgi:hypothetical protein